MTPAITGAMVFAVRNGHGLNRDQFYAMGGWTGKSVARLANIEKNESWTDGDMARVLSVFEQLGVTESELDALRAMPVETLLATSRAGRKPSAKPGPKKDRAPRARRDSTRTDVARNVGAVATLTREDVLDLVSETDFVEWLSPETHAEYDLEREFQKRHIEPMAVAPAASPASTRASTIPAGLYVITNGQINDYKQCKRKWWLTWYRKLGLANQSSVDARAIGTRIHRALQAWYTADPAARVDPRQAHESILFEEWNRTITALQKDADGLTVQSANEQFKKVAALERAMIEGYVDWLRETGEDAEFEVLGAEQVVEATMDVERSDGSGVQTVHLKAKLDARVRRLSDGVRLFLDHKTTASLDEPVTSLHMNPQMLFYHFLEWLATEDGEERCDGALYNMLKKSKRTERAKPPFYKRVEVQHNRYELEAFKLQLEGTVDEILTTVSRLDAELELHHRVVPPSKGADCKYRCDFYAVCTMFDDGSRVEDALAGIYTHVDPAERYDYGTTIGGTE